MDGDCNAAAKNPLGAGGIDQRAARHLAGERKQSAHGQEEANIALRPFLRGQIDCDQWSETHLCVGEKEHEPIQRPQTFARGARRQTAACFYSRDLIVARFVCVRPGWSASTIAAQSGRHRHFSGARFSDFAGVSGLGSTAGAAPSTTSGSPGRYSGASLT